MSSSDERFERMMKEAIAPNIEPDRSLNEKIITGAFEPKKAKVSSLPRLIAVAAIVVALGSAGVYAGVQIHKKLLDVNVKDSIIHVGEEPDEWLFNPEKQREPLVSANYGTDVYETYESYDEAVEKAEAGLVFSEMYQLNGVVDVTKYEVGGDSPSNCLKAEFLYKDGSFVENYKVNHGCAVSYSNLPYANACNEREYVAPNDFVYTLVDCELYTYMGPNDYLKETGTDVAIYYNYRDDSNGGMLCSVECDLFFKNLSEEDIYHVLDTIILPEEASFSEEELWGEKIELEKEEYYHSYKEAIEQTGVGFEFSEEYKLNGSVEYCEFELDDGSYHKNLLTEFFYNNGGFIMICEESDGIGLYLDDKTEIYVSKSGIEFGIYDCNDGNIYVEFLYRNNGEDTLCQFTFVGLSEDEIHHVLDTVIIP